MTVAPLLPVTRLRLVARLLLVVPPARLHLLANDGWLLLFFSSPGRPRLPERIEAPLLMTASPAQSRPVAAKGRPRAPAGKGRPLLTVVPLLQVAPLRLVAPLLLDVPPARPRLHTRVKGSVRPVAPRARPRLPARVQGPLPLAAPPARPRLPARVEGPLLQITLPVRLRLAAAELRPVQRLRSRRPLAMVVPASRSRAPCGDRSPHRPLCPPVGRERASRLGAAAAQGQRQVQWQRGWSDPACSARRHWKHRRRKALRCCVRDRYRPRPPSKGFSRSPKGGRAAHGQMHLQWKRGNSDLVICARRHRARRSRSPRRRCFLLI